MRGIRRLGDQIRRLGRSGGGSSAYLLLDLFASGGVTSPRACVPGPGSLTITDPDGALSISGGALVWNDASLSGATGMVGASAIARQDGLALLATLTNRTAIANAVRVGWHDSAATVTSTTPLYALRITNATTAVASREGSDGSSGPNISISGSAVAYSALVIVRNGGGGFVLDREGGSGNWTLRWVYSRTTNASLVPIVHSPQAASDARFTQTEIRVWLASEFATRWGAATYYSATPSSGAVGTGSANTIVSASWTPASAETLNLIFRRTDASNYWTVRGDQAGSTIKLIQVVAGVETERSSAAQTWTVGTKYRVTAIADGTIINTHTTPNPDSASTSTQKNSYSSATAHQTSTDVGVTYGSGAVVDLVSWPRTIAVAVPA